MNSSPNRTITGRSLDRVINFSDAVVAVAITVLVLPIVDIQGPTDTHSMLSVLSDNSDQLIAFGLTFLILFILWQGHHRVFENFVAIDNTIMWINAGWLATVAFLPWPSRLIDVSANSAGAGWLYCLTLFLNAVFLHFIYQHGRKHPGYLTNVDLWSSWVSISFVFAVAFGIMVIASILVPAMALWLLFLLLPLRFFVQQKGRLPASVTRSSSKRRN
ncbi:unannotated protein [freshwater metagenome]|uniref:Unannotated protein n=1 Tax=freshwater metagenome TaxID=449393 RepID=A0A6J7GG26_9ZZZZ